MSAQTVLDTFPCENWARISLFHFLSFNQFIIHERIVAFLLACDCQFSLRGFERHCEMPCGNQSSLYQLTSFTHVSWLLRNRTLTLQSLKNNVRLTTFQASYGKGIVSKRLCATSNSLIISFSLIIFFYVCLFVCFVICCIVSSTQKNYEPSLLWYCHF